MPDKDFRPEIMFPKAEIEQIESDMGLTENEKVEYRQFVADLISMGTCNLVLIGMEEYKRVFDRNRMINAPLN